MKGRRGPDLREEILITITIVKNKIKASVIIGTEFGVCKINWTLGIVENEVWRVEGLMRKKRVNSNKATEKRAARTMSLISVNWFGEIAEK